MRLLTPEEGSTSVIKGPKTQNKRWNSSHCDLQVSQSGSFERLTSKIHPKFVGENIIIQRDQSNLQNFN